MSQELIILISFFMAAWVVHFVYGIKLFSKRRGSVIHTKTGKLYVRLRLSTYGILKLAFIFATVRLFLIDISEYKLDAMIKKEIRVTLEKEV